MKLTCVLLSLSIFLSSCGSGSGGGSPSPEESCVGTDWIDYSDLSGISDGVFGVLTSGEVTDLSSSYTGLTTNTPAYRTTHFLVINTSSMETDEISLKKYAKTLEKLLAFELDRLGLSFSDLNLTGKQKYVAGGNRMPFIIFNSSSPGQGNGGNMGDAGSVSMNSINNSSARKTIHHEFIHTLEGLLTQGSLGKNFYNGYWFTEGIATYLSGQCTSPSAFNLDAWSNAGGVNDVLLKDWRATEFRVANIYFVGASATAYLFNKGDVTTQQLGEIWKASGQIDTNGLDCTGLTSSDCVNHEVNRIWKDKTGKDFSGYATFEEYRQNFFHGQKLYRNF